MYVYKKFMLVHVVVHQSINYVLSGPASQSALVLTQGNEFDKGCSIKVMATVCASNKYVKVTKCFNCMNTC